MVDLKGNPFFLNTQQIAWVKETLANMSTDEKIGQLFCPICVETEPEYLENEMLRYHVGGLMFKTYTARGIRKAMNYLQRKSAIPMLCGANLEYGSAAFIVEGTHFAQQMGIAATQNTENAYRMAKVSCEEAAAVGCNFAFAPVSDLDLNWRNPIVNVRSYGREPATVLEMCKAYKRGADEAGVAISVKHFPGDGCDEVDQHLQVSINNLSCAEWDCTYGYIYKGMIADGTKVFMIGHIDQPAYRHAINPQADETPVPATLSKELVTGLLRGKLHFNGMVITDASIMVGFTAAMRRSEAVPTAIESGCDMFLFNKSMSEDFVYMQEGLRNGLLSQARLDEAVTRILALKASLGLSSKPREEIVPPEEAMQIIGCAKHQAWAQECAQDAITLVKDKYGVLPLRPEKCKRLLLEVMGNGVDDDEALGCYFAEKLRDEGFEVTIYKPENFTTYRYGVKPFTDKYDGVIYFGNIINASNKTTNRLNWHTYFGHGDNVPWFVHEVPVIFVSLANPYHLIDVPMIPTYINCYSSNHPTLDALIDKLVGRSAFTGVSPVDPFLGKMHLRL